MKMFDRKGTEGKSMQNNRRRRPLPQENDYIQDEVGGACRRNEKCLILKILVGYRGYISGEIDETVAVLK
jgi:hypothetical protein